MKKLLLLSLTFFLTFGCRTSNFTEIEKRYIIANKGNKKFYLIDIIKKNQQNGMLDSIPMLIIDGKPYTYNIKDVHEEINISKRSIKKVEIMDKEKSIPIYGKAGRNGLMLIYTY